MKDTRWIPVLAALLGVLGGIAGAYIGGNVANAGAEKRFERERAAQVQDIRIDVYADYLGTAEQLATAWLTTEDDQKITDAIGRLFVAEAKVLVIAEDQNAVGNAVLLVDQLLTAGTGFSQEQVTDYQSAYKAFLDVARQEISKTSE